MTRSPETVRALENARSALEMTDGQLKEVVEKLRAEALVDIERKFRDAVRERSYDTAFELRKRLVWLVNAIEAGTEHDPDGPVGIAGQPRQRSK
jgi:hypothetical protein